MMTGRLPLWGWWAYPTISLSPRKTRLRCADEEKHMRVVDPNRLAVCWSVSERRSMMLRLVAEPAILRIKRDHIWSNEHFPDRADTEGRFRPSFACI